MWEEKDRIKQYALDHPLTLTIFKSLLHFSMGKMELSHAYLPWRKPQVQFLIMNVVLHKEKHR